MFTKSSIDGHKLRHTAIAGAIAASLGMSAVSDQALGANLTFSFTGTGLFTMLDPAGVQLQNTSKPYYYDATWGYGLRTQITGTLTYDTSTGAGSATITPFEFFNKGKASAHDIVLQNIGNGSGGAGTLFVGKMLFDWAVTSNINLGIIWDAAGLLNAIPTLNVGDTLNPGNCTGCVTPASNGISKNNFPIGPAPVATTTMDTDFHNGGANIIGDDGIGGDPMDNGPFPGFSANFDFVELTLISDGSGPVFTPPADVNFIAPEQNTPVSVNVDLQSPTGVVPPGTTTEYSTDGKAVSDPTKVWITDGSVSANNTISVNAISTITNLTVDWRATDPGMAQSFLTQNVVVTITDTTAPTLSVPADVGPVTIDANYNGVDIGVPAASDAIEPNLTIEYSVDGGTTWKVSGSSNIVFDFAENATTAVTWRATDVAGNSTTNATQMVTLSDLPAGMVGVPCSIDLTTAGLRDTVSRFQMRDPEGGPVGAIDNTVTGDIDPTLICVDAACSNLTPPGSGATLSTIQPFFQLTWKADPIRLFGPGSYTFETCPFPRTPDGEGDWMAADGSAACGSEFTPNEVTLNVAPGQLGAHMLFKWGNTSNIDVVVAWDVGCNEFDLTATDPDGDGFRGTPMVDGPFNGFNAAFDVSSTTGANLADGGYQSSIPTVKNPSGSRYPIPIAVDNTTPAVTDSAVLLECVGGCAGFSTSNLTTTSDLAGTYKFAQVVYKLTTPTPQWSVYRKFDALGMTWSPFVLDSRNDVNTARSVGGLCPPPGDASYSRPAAPPLIEGLWANHDCVEVTVENDGPNDANADPNIVDDPGGVGQVNAPVVPAPSTGGGCAVGDQSASATRGGAWWLLAGMLGWLGWQRRKSR